MSQLTKAFSWEEFSRKETALPLIALSLFLLVSFVSILERPYPGLSRIAAEGPEILNFSPVPPLRIFGEAILLPLEFVRLVLSLFIVLLPFFTFCAVASARRRTFGLVGLALAFLFRVYLYGLNILEAEVYFHVHIFLFLVFLFFPEKIFSLRIAIAAVYFAAGLQKLNSSWVLGRYFLSTPGGLPLFPETESSIIAVSNLLILLELVGPFFLIWGKERTRLLAVCAFTAFHAYSILIISWIFPFLMLTVLWAVYGEPRPQLADGRSRKKRQISAAAILIVLLASQYHLLIPGAKSVTHEGVLGGLFMFDANSACKADITITKNPHVYRISHTKGYRKGVVRPDGTVVKHRLTEFDAVQENGKRLYPDMHGIVRGADGASIYNTGLICSDTGRICCDPYVYFQFSKLLQKSGAAEKIDLKLAIDLNGHGRWFELVNRTDFPGRFDYSFFRHNEWISIPDSSYPHEYRWP